jgi:energy-coupling factor transport system permease protein
MSDRLSFYIRRNSPLHRLNPFTKLVLVFGSILISYFSAWYWTAVLLIVLLFVASVIGSVQREYFGVCIRLILPVVAFLFLMQAFFLPGGITEIWRLGPLSLKAENLQTAFLNGMRIFSMVSSFTLFLLTTHPSELMSDLTHRGLPSQFAYVIISTIQIIPQMQAKAQTIIAAQRARGLDTQGSFIKRIGALLPLVGPLVFGSLVEVEERAIAIEARGFTSTGAKTSLREIPDAAPDRLLRWLALLFVLAAIVSRIWLS